MTPSKPHYVWRREPPDRSGKWWWVDKSSEPIIVDVYKEGQYWCIGDPDDEDEGDFVENWCEPLHDGALWAGPVQLPVYPPPGTLD